MKYYQYLYYKIYSGLGKLGKWELPFKVMCTLSVLLEINIMKIDYHFQIFIFPGDDEFKSKIRINIIYAVLLAINYYLFLYKKKYKEIEKRFKKESNTSRIIGNIVVSLYAIGTVVSLFIW